MIVKTAFYPFVNFGFGASSSCSGDVASNVAAHYVNVTKRSITYRYRMGFYNFRGSQRYCGFVTSTLRDVKWHNTETIS